MKNPLNYASCLGLTLNPSTLISSDPANTYIFSFANLITWSVATGSPSYTTDVTTNYVVSASASSISTTTSCKISSTPFSIGPPAPSNFSTNITYDIKTGPMAIALNTFSISPTYCSDLNPTYTSIFNSHFAFIDSSG